MAIHTKGVTSAAATQRCDGQLAICSLVKRGSRRYLTGLHSLLGVVKSSTHRSTYSSQVNTSSGPATIFLTCLRDL